MELTLEQCIQYLLYRDQKLTLPGIGVLSIKRQPAQFTEQRTELLPPAFSVVFDERIDDPYTTIPKTYESIYNASADVIRNAIHETGKANLFGLGRLIHDGQQVVFEQNLQTVDKIWGGLQPISPIEEVKRTYSQKPETVPAVEIATFQQRKTKNYGWIKWALVALFALVLFYFLLFFKWESGSTEVAEIENTISDTLPPVTQNEPVSTTEAIQTIVDTSANVSSITSTKTTQPSDNQLFDYIIITGSFKKLRHIERMATKLEQMGYEVYKADNDSTTRVGLKIRCTEARMAATLAKIRQEIEPGAWLLK